MTATAVDLHGPRGGTGRFAALDGLRGVAILLVLAHHLWPMPHVGRWSPPLGHLGVSLFFVLSGFLITRILLKCRDDLAAGARLRDVTRSFYLRRALRIVPPYAMLLIVLVLLDVRHVRERWLWHATYLSNWHLAMDVPLATKGFDRHLWSLSVEEQFYLVWPVIVLLLPRRLLAGSFVLVMALAALWRWTAWELEWPIRFIELPTPAVMDFLAAGGLVAVLSRSVPWQLIFWITIVPALAMQGPLGNWMLDGRIAFNNTLLSIAFASWIGWIIAGSGDGRLRRCLSVRPLVAIGTVSYAAYLVHTVSGPMARAMLPIDDPWLVGFVATSLTLGLATLSWWMLERPVLRLKDRFDYPAPRESERP